MKAKNVSMKKTKMSVKKPMDRASLGPAMSAGAIPGMGMKSGGACKGYAKGGAIDGVAKKGKTKGKIC